MYQDNSGPRIGDTVWLISTEDSPEQAGVVLDVSIHDFDINLTVELFPEYRDGDGDDGLRDVPYDQVRLRRTDDC